MPGKTGDNLLQSSWSAVWTTSSTVWALLRPAATPVSWFPTLTSPSMARGQHSLLPGQGGRCDRSLESSRSSEKFSKLMGEDAPVVLLPSWLERDKNA